MVVFQLYRVALAAVIAVAPAAAAQFSFDTIVRLGQNGNGSSGWETGLGDGNGAFPSRMSLATYWQSGQARQFQVIYDRPTHNLQVRVYSASGATYQLDNYAPANPAIDPAALWTLPASAFFVSAFDDVRVNTSISISSLALSSPTGGALSILQPFTSTTLTASSGPGLPTQTVRQGQDIVFRGDANGSWRLTGIVTMTFAGLGGGSPNSGKLQFGFNATAHAPEPSVWATAGLGMLVILLLARGRKTA